MRRNGRKIAAAAALVLAVAAAGWFLLRAAPLDTLIPILKTVHPGYLGLGLAVMLAFIACEAAGSRRILRALGEKPRYWRCVHYSLTGFCCASLTPSSSGGQPAQIMGMCRDGIRGAHASLTMLVLAICYQISLLALGGAAWLYVGWKSGGVGWLLALGVAVNVLLTGTMLCAMFCPALARRVVRGLVSLGARLRLVRRPDKALSKSEEGLKHYAAGAECIRCRPALVGQVLLCTTAQVLCLALIPWVCSLALQVDAFPPEVMATQVVLTLSVAAFPMPGGSGAAEGGFLAVFRELFSPALVGPAMVLSRGLSCYLFLPLCAVLAWVTRGGRLRRSRRAAREYPAQQRPAARPQARENRPLQRSETAGAGAKRRLAPCRRRIGRPAEEDSRRPAFPGRTAGPYRLHLSPGRRAST